ncbi:YetF domain-containing protein [Fodinicurvata sp. EGI_FJ10296]|jgi:uncharacterized membrane protein YcaP (DUF421 family)|uniref:DUF421 domain-containing protein n=1 Tax=Fodinicurvata sp. EGI_FJ10296 TaxID=3231908 RepID=UPI0034525F74
MLFAEWTELGRVLLVGTAAYALLVVFLRVSGKRTLTKLNAFDLVITVALGSSLSAVLLNKSVSLAEGMVGMGLLIALQFIITWLSVRSAGFHSIIKAEPTLLVRNGAYLDSALRQQRMTRDEILAAARSSGHNDIGQLEAVILETDGSISTIPKSG